MMEFLLNIDTDIFLFFNGMHSAFADRFMRLVSERFIWVPMYGALLFVIIKNYGWQKGLIILACTVLAICASDQLCATLLRPAVQRLRPANPANALSTLVHTVNGYRGGNYGFPSCHAANTFALVGLMVPLMHNLRVGICLVAWALINCYSRIHLGVHYPGDLLVGAMLGFVIGYAFYWLVRMSAFCGRVPQPVNGETTEVYIASSHLSSNILLRMGSFSFRHTDFVTIAAVTTLLAITLAAL